MEENVRILCELDGVSGREDKVRDYIISELPGDVAYQVDKLGNLICHKEGTKGMGKNKLMLCAHMDEVGLIVTYITDEGLLKVDEIGGIDPAVLIGRPVKLEGGATGVIGLKHVHLCTEEEREQIPKLKELYVDIGAHSKKEAEYEVFPGDYAVFDSQFQEFGTDNNKWKGKALDDRVGCAILLDLLNSEVDYDVDVVFTVQEEVGARGAGAAAFTVNPDICVVLETTTAGDIEGVTGEKRACALGQGPVVPFMDRGTVYDTELFRMTMKKAEELELKAQTKTVIAGGNDASSVQASGTGTRVIAMAVPTRYLHSPSCVMDAEDVHATNKLLKACLPFYAEL